MTLIAITLVTIGCADLLRHGARFARLRHPYPAILLAFLLPILLGWLIGLEYAQDWLVLYLGIATAIAWVFTSHDAVVHERRHGRPLLVLLLGIIVMAAYGTLSATQGSTLDRWLTGNAFTVNTTLSADAVLLIIGALLIQLGTGNIIVRLVLAHIGALRPPGQPQPSDKLKGGRLLGPMERVFILGLGLAGQVTAAGLVIAAKGLIRFPELQAQAKADADDPLSTRRGQGIDELTEYFLIGSFVSWLVALTTLALVWLGT